MSNPVRITSLFGTRPEAIKMAPVVRLLDECPWVEPAVVVTGQHREMLDQVLSVFAIRPDLDLGLMRPGESLAEFAARALEATSEALSRLRPDLLLVQGDTTSAFIGALAAFYQHIPVGHIEAGLRSYDRYDPFPEEVNRHLLSVLAELHFAPTERARRSLLVEHVPDEKIVVTGNTVIDALLTVSQSRRLEELPLPPGTGQQRRMILVTLHRRESWGEPMAQMCQALRRVLDAFPDVELLFPMHRNPIVRRSVEGALAAHQRAHLIEPLGYLEFVKAMSLCHLIVTDSGGIQEEAPALAKPVLVLRETTERPEAVEAGTARLVGTAPEKIFASVGELLSEPATYHAMAHSASPFGDGHATERIVETIRAWAVKARLLDDAAA